MVDAYILELGGIDLILGMEWLKTLGEVKFDWNKKIITIEHNGRTVT